MKKIYILLGMLLFMTAPVFAGEGPEDQVFQQFADDALSFFAPVSGSVLKVGGDVVEIGIGAKEKVRVGMRLKVFRKGEEFSHPVTGEILGKIETEVGSVEVESVGEAKSSVRLFAGEIREGDRIRISKGTIPLLFYQTKSVDWVIGDALYNEFKRIGRFEIIETPKDEESVDMMMGEVAKHKASLGVFLKQRGEGGDVILDVAFYHADGAKFYERPATIGRAKIDELKFGYGFLQDIESTYQLAFQLPASSKFISACDVDGDGNDELVLVMEGEMEIFEYGVSLKSIAAVKTDGMTDPIRMECEDINRDGKAEIVITSAHAENVTDVADDSRSAVGLSRVTDKGVISEIYIMKEGELSRTYMTYGFVKVLSGSLLIQAFSVSEGYSGKVYAMRRTDGGWTLGKALPLPPKTNIYDFMPVEMQGGKGYFVVDNMGYVNLFNPEGIRIWRTSDKIGFPREFEIPASTVMQQPDKWYIKDKMVLHKGRYFLIKREPFADTAPGLGSASSDLVALSTKGMLVKEDVVLKDIGGTMLDFTILEDKLVVLVRPFLGMNMKNLLRLKNPFKRNLYVFSLK